MSENYGLIADQNLNYISHYSEIETICSLSFYIGLMLPKNNNRHKQVERQFLRCAENCQHNVLLKNCYWCQFPQYNFSKD